MQHEMMTAEDLAIRERIIRSDAARYAYRCADARDASLMAELGDRNMGRATLAPITLATIGLPWQEVQAIARECHGVRPVEHIELCPHGLGFDPNTETDPAHCEDCQQSRAEDSEVPADWFAGGFADNH